jgi:hypothetical protein
MLHATKSVMLPVTVRLIFVGFEGDGNQGLSLDLQNLEGWFEHIEHTLRHTRVSTTTTSTTPASTSTSRNNNMGKAGSGSGGTDNTANTDTVGYVSSL